MKSLHKLGCFFETGRDYGNHLGRWYREFGLLKNYEIQQKKNTLEAIIFREKLQQTP